MNANISVNDLSDSIRKHMGILLRKDEKDKLIVVINSTKDIKTFKDELYRFFNNIQKEKFPKGHKYLNLSELSKYDSKIYNDLYNRKEEVNYDF